MFVQSVEQRSLLNAAPKKINMGNIGDIPIPLPPLPEQRAIAEVLSDVDALLASLERLIAKKRAIKQGAMQQLLTGRTRLPGFTGEWETKRLGEIGEFQSGNGFPIKYQGETEGDYPFFKVSDMNNEGNEIVMVTANNWITESTRRAIGASTLPTHSIVFAKIGAAIFLERKKLLLLESCIDNNMMGFVPDDSISDYRFVHQLLLNTQLGKLVSTTALPYLGRKEIAELEYPLPRLEEQRAIAEVLSDMDAEIAALETRREKNRAIKQGMMQELLTGRIRLIEN
jgi:type I restriction enzyme S subunit